MARAPAAKWGPIELGPHAELEQPQIDTIWERTGVKASWRARAGAGRGKKLYLVAPPAQPDAVFN